MISGSIQAGLSVILIMIFALSGISFWYSMKKLAHMFVVAFKDEEPY